MRTSDRLGHSDLDRVGLALCSLGQGLQAVGEHQAHAADVRVDQFQLAAGLPHDGWHARFWWWAGSFAFLHALEGCAAVAAAVVTDRHDGPLDGHVSGSTGGALDGLVLDAPFPSFSGCFSRAKLKVWPHSLQWATPSANQLSCLGLRSTSTRGHPHGVVDFVL